MYGSPMAMGYPGQAGMYGVSPAMRPPMASAGVYRPGQFTPAAMGAAPRAMAPQAALSARPAAIPASNAAPAPARVAAQSAPRQSQEKVQLSQPTSISLHGAKPNPYVTNASAAAAAAEAMVDPNARQRDVWAGGSVSSQSADVTSPQPASIPIRAPPADATRNATLHKNNRISQAGQEQAVGSNSSVSSQAKRTNTVFRPASNTSAPPSRKSSAAADAPPPKPRPPESDAEPTEMNLHSKTRTINIKKGADGFGFVIRGI